MDRADGVRVPARYGAFRTPAGGYQHGQQGGQQQLPDAQDTPKAVAHVTSRFKDLLGAYVRARVGRAPDLAFNHALFETLPMQPFAEFMIFVHDHPNGRRFAATLRRSCEDVYEGFKAMTGESQQAWLADHVVPTRIGEIASGPGERQRAG